MLCSYQEAVRVSIYFGERYIYKIFDHTQGSETIGGFSTSDTRVKGGRSGQEINLK